MKNKKIAPLIGIAARAQWTKTIQRKKRRLAPQKAETGKKPHGTVCVAKPFLPFSLRRRRRSPAEPSADRPASAGPHLPCPYGPPPSPGRGARRPLLPRRGRRFVRLRRRAPPPRRGIPRGRWGARSGAALSPRQPERLREGEEIE